MATTKSKGDLAELMVAADLRRKGYKIAIPFGEDDLILERGDRLERVQVKYATSDGAVIEARCRSHSLTNGKIKRTKYYTAATIDWLAIYDATTQRCFYVPVKELGNGRNSISLRLAPARNHQSQGIRWRRIRISRRRHSRSSFQWSQRDSNPRPRRCKRRALPTELWPQLT